MISIIIPCYNAKEYIEETIQSILNQMEEFEIIVIDDGSTDSSAQILQKIVAPELSYFYQKNKGVSVARNKGLEYAKGEYVIFFDADDKMSENFLGARKKVMDFDKAIGFSCGPVSSFPGAHQHTIGVADNIERALLTYQPQFSSCPSNYLIRTSILMENSIFFNESLSSTADRFFLLQLSRFTKGSFINTAPLFYRVSLSSMSGTLTKELLLDNENYFHLLVKNNMIPIALKNDFYFKISYILGLGFLKKGSLQKGVFYITKAIVQNPLRFLKKRWAK